MTPIKNADGQVIGYKLDEPAPETPAPVYLYAPEESKPEFKVGDRVRVTGSKEELKKYYADPAFGQEGVVVSQTEYAVSVKIEARGAWSINPIHLEKIEETEAEWNPKTEPINVGDRVMVVFDGRSDMGTVTKVDGPVYGDWTVKEDNGSTGRWSMRSSLLLMSKAGS